DARLGAEHVVGRVRDAGRDEPADGGYELLIGRVRLPEQLALLAVVDERPRRVAEEDLAEELRVIRDRGEVERATDPAAPGLLLVVVRERDRGAACEGVGVGRADPRAEDVRVRGQAGVDVQVAEVRVTKRVEARARLA